MFDEADDVEDEDGCDAAIRAAAADSGDSDFLFNTLNIIPRPVFVKFPFTCHHRCEYFVGKVVVARTKSGGK